MEKDQEPLGALIAATRNKVPGMLSRVNGQLGQVGGQLSQISGLLGQLNGQVGQLSGQISHVGLLLSQADERLSRATDQFNELNTQLGERSVQFGLQLDQASGLLSRVREEIRLAWRELSRVQAELSGTSASSTDNPEGQHAEEKHTTPPPSFQ